MNPQRRRLLSASILAPVMAGALGTLGGCASLGFGPRELAFSYASLNERLSRRFPVERNVAGFIRANIMRPRLGAAPTAGQGAPMRLQLTVDLDISLPSLTGGNDKTLWGTASFSGVPRVDAALRGIALDDPRVDRINIDNIPDALSAAVANTASQLAREALTAQLLYPFNDEQRERIKRWSGDANKVPAIRVEGVQLVVVRP
jgi:hypothetical protein